MKLNKTFKKVLSVVLALAMVVTSITVYNTTAKAAAGDLTLEAHIEAEGTIGASWTNPTGTDVTNARGRYYLVKSGTVTTEEEVKNLTQDDYARSERATWTWSVNNANEFRKDLDRVDANHGKSIDIVNGGKYQVVVVIYNLDYTEILAYDVSNEVEIVANTTLALTASYTGNTATLKWSKIANATSYEITVAGVGTYTTEKTSYDVSLPESAKDYDCTIVAKDAEGNEITLSDDNTTVLNAPLVKDLGLEQTGFRWDAGAGNAGTYNVNLKWNSVTGTAKYRLTLDGGDTYSWQGNAETILSAGITSKEVYIPGGSHTIKLTAYDAEDNELVSAEYSVDTVEQFPDSTQESFVVDPNVNNKLVRVKVGDAYTLPEKEGSLGYVVNGKNYPAGSQYTVGNKTVTFEEIKVSLALNAGASIKINAAGIRFKTTPTANTSDVEYGTLIIPNDVLKENTSDEVLVLGTEGAVDVPTETWADEEKTSYIAALVGMGRDNYTRDYSARAYAKVKYADGTTSAPIYSDNTTTKNIKLIYDYVSDETQKSAIKEFYGFE